MARHGDRVAFRALEDGGHPLLALSSARGLAFFGTRMATRKLGGAGGARAICLGGGRPTLHLLKGVVINETIY